MLIENVNKDFLNAYIRTRQKGRNIPDHIHTNYEFVYFFSGGGVLKFENQEYEFKQGSYYIMNPGIIHNESYTDDGTSLVVWFQAPKDVEIETIFQNDSKYNLFSEVSKIKSEIEKQSFGYKEMIDILIKEIFITLSRQQHIKQVESVHDIQGSIDYINEYFMTEIRISELAEDCSYCEDHFRVLFKEKTGYSPKDYILKKRIEYAKKLLIEGNAEISDIYALCGFKTYSQFMTFFKNQTQYSPKKYRDKFKINRDY